jgi:hypothetical protein
MTKNTEEKTYEEMTKSERQKLFREVERDCSVSDRTTETAGACVPEWIDEWIA